MNIREVIKLPVAHRMAYFINEREYIRLLKEKGARRPWTDDEILGTYRFCNIRRMDDRVSEWLIDNWYTTYRDHPNMLIAVCLARFFNLPSTLAHIGFPSEWNPDTVRERVRSLHRKGVNVFNGAYIVRGNDGEDKIESVTHYYVNPLYEKHLQRALPTDSMEETASLIQDQHGYGSFMAGQVVADLRWALSGEWKDRNDWAPVGPGSSRGLRRYTDDTPGNLTKVYKPSEFLPLIRDMMSSLRKVLPFDITSRLEAHDYQNCLCEFDKYERALHKQGKPKQKYTPHKGS